MLSRVGISTVEAGPETQLDPRRRPELKLRAKSSNLLKQVHKAASLGQSAGTLPHQLALACFSSEPELQFKADCGENFSLRKNLPL